MSSGWHQDQHTKAKTYKPKAKKSQIPGSYGCAGDCSQPAPPAPGKGMETFASGSNGSTDTSTPYLLTLAVAAALYVAVTLISKRVIRR